MKNRALVCAVLFALASSGCGGCGEKDAPSTDGTPAVEATTPEVAPEPATPADPELVKLAALLETARGLPAPDAEDRQPREAFRREALTMGNAAIGTRMDVVVGVAEALWTAGEGETAAAFLQRTVGMTRDKEVGSEHMHALARLKVELDAPLEGASLMERAIDREAATASDFAMLSWTYLRAGRLGPGRAAVRRGERKHPSAPELALAGAVVALVEGKTADALSAVDGKDGALALRIKAEAQLASGDRAGAKATAEALSKAAPENPWGPLLLGAVGGAGKADALGKARTLASADMQWVDARQALEWAAAVGDGAAAWARHPELAKLAAATAAEGSAPVAEKPADGSGTAPSGESKPE